MVAPEFLDQHSPYYAHSKHLIGVANIYHAQTYRNIFNLQGYGHADIRTTSIKTAVMSKSVHNCHAAIKVSFFNEVFDVCEKENISYREMMQCIFSMNDNLHPQYTKMSVDGSRGYGGFCIPKDSVAFANEYDILTLKAAVEANCKWRKEDMDKCLK
jgi:UDP-glucose 6-dehydrogenase